MNLMILPCCFFSWLITRTEGHLSKQSNVASAVSTIPTSALEAGPEARDLQGSRKGDADPVHWTQSGWVRARPAGEASEDDGPGLYGPRPTTPPGTDAATTNSDKNKRLRPDYFDNDHLQFDAANDSDSDAAPTTGSDKGERQAKDATNTNTPTAATVSAAAAGAKAPAAPVPRPASRRIWERALAPNPASVAEHIVSLTGGRIAFQRRSDQHSEPAQQPPQAQPGKPEAQPEAERSLAAAEARAQRAEERAQRAEERAQRAEERAQRAAAEEHPEKPMEETEKPEKPKEPEKPASQDRLPEQEPEKPARPEKVETEAKDQAAPEVAAILRLRSLLRLKPLPAPTAPNGTHIVYQAPNGTNIAADLMPAEKPAPEDLHVCFPFVMINLDRRADRLEDMENTLPPSICERTCRIPAVDPREMKQRPPFISETEWTDARKRDAFRNYTNGENLTTGAIGLLMTTHQIWERIVEAGVPVVIMEDDINITDPTRLMSEMCKLRSRDDWEIVQFQSDGDFSAQARYMDFSGITTPRMLPGVLWNAGMYAITPAFAKRLLDLVDRAAPHGGPGAARELADPRGAVRLTATRGFHFYPPLAMQTKKGSPTSDVQIRNQRSGEPSKKSCKVDTCNINYLQSPGSSEIRYSASVSRAERGRTPARKKTLESTLPLLASTADDALSTSEIRKPSPVEEAPRTSKAVDASSASDIRKALPGPPGAATQVAMHQGKGSRGGQFPPVKFPKFSKFEIPEDEFPDAID